MAGSTKMTLAFAALVVACNGGGPSDPEDPSNGLQVSGTWTETSQIVSNPCGIDLPGQVTGSFQLVQSGTQLTATSDGETVTGTLNLTTGDFTLAGSFDLNGLNVTVVQSGRFSSSTRYTAETVITLSDGVQTCTVRTSDTGTR